MMALRDTIWKRRYKSSEDSQQLLNDFFRPAIKNSTVYFRGSGFFSSSMFNSIGESLGDFVENGGRMRLVTNVVLSPTDLTAIENGQKSKKDFVEEEVVRIVNEEFRSPMNPGSLILTRLLEMNRLEIKIGVKQRGIYHEKIGIFFDDQEVDLDGTFEELKQHEHLAFFGSVNEGVTAWEDSHENFKVYPSWNENRIDDANDTLEDFIDNWHGRTSGLDVYDFSEAMAANLIRSKEETEQGNQRTPREFPADEPIVDEKWKHQDEAVEWFCNGKANGIGIFEMATGSGKTWTSMRCMKHMLEMSMCNRVIVSVPKSLLNQWRKELTTFLGLRSDGGHIAALYEYSGLKKEHLRFKQSGSNSFLLVSHTMLLPLLAISKTWSNDLLSGTFCVVDEMHNIGADRFRPDESSDDDDEIIDLGLQEESFSLFGSRLGLSATPWSLYDEDNLRNKFLAEKFTRFPLSEKNLFSNDEWRQNLIDDGYVFNFSLKDGINRGILAEFDYEPLSYEPSEFEKEDYRQKVRGAHFTDDNGQSSILGAIRAASVFKGSRQKIPVFKEWLESNQTLDRTLIFVEDTSFGIELMAELALMGYTNFTKFFQGDDDWNLKSFASGETDFLISCHRISEGIDIRTVNKIVLFSSATTQLETIQRIGRALRKGDQSKRSTVLDFVYEDCIADATRREWLIHLSGEREDE